MNLGELIVKHGPVYFIGIKGTGMCALAELFHDSGIAVSGSDQMETFYTDGILRELRIPYYEGFDPAHVPAGAVLAIHSAAYSAETNPEMAEVQRRGIPLVKYPDALGAYSALFDSSGVAGVHGKTTTTAMAGVLFRAAGIPGKILTGSAVSAFGGRSTLSLGEKYFTAETCEYRRHFLAFHPRRIVLTSVESDHQDYFPRYEDIRDAFVEYAAKLPPGGELIYCADDPGACEVAAKALGGRPDIRALPYGFTAQGKYRIDSYDVREERVHFTLGGFYKPRGAPGEKQVFALRAPGRHCVLDAAAALALTDRVARQEFGEQGPAPDRAAEALEEFRGSRRRSEILGEAGGILFMDDYGHHPTAIRATLQGLREFYPSRRIVLSFMSHTYTRTAAMLDEFAASVLSADIIFLHKIYASARESRPGGVTGLSLYKKVRELRDGVYYTEEPEDAAEELKRILRGGDLFITMGAGDNWRLGKELFDSWGRAG
ncbi:MAG: UDP-N-acetylmuramate--L-alanine ligase [Spirochaetaceae bacterium]|jgi:UDP-N-acetylmuramate--alanine ligase|nr:UDP-N-acetylmuramate--L-alanine ligase [Spirochaetaceae bacterium]